MSMRSADVPYGEWLKPAGADLADAFGPRWEAVVAMISRAQRLTSAEVEDLLSARDQIQADAYDAVWDAAVAAGSGRLDCRDAATNAALAVGPRARGEAIATVQYTAAPVGRDVAMDVAQYEGRDIPAPAWDAVWAVCAGDLVGRYDGDRRIFEQDHLDILLGPWNRVIGGAE